MNRWCWIGILAGAGLLCSLGVWITGGGWWLQAVESPSEEEVLPPQGSTASAPVQPPPKLVIDKTEHDFGTIDPMAKGEHAFVVRNEGSGPLELSPGPTSCKCTLSDLPDRIVPPGKSGRIVLSWNATEKQGPFRQVATIRTNDPARPDLDLRIVGSVSVRLGMEPAQVYFPSIQPRTNATTEVLVFSQAWPEFNIAKIESSRPGLTCSVEPADPARLKEREALAGYRLKIAVPGDLPSGNFSEWLRIEVDPRAGAAPRETRQLAVGGEVLSRMALYGDKLVLGKVLKLGAVRHGETTRERLTMVLRDEPRQIAVQRIETKPDFLRVEVSKLSAERSQAGVYRIDVEVPPGAPACSFMGANQGEIVIVTDHPRVPRVRLNVEMAVFN